MTVLKYPGEMTKANIRKAEKKHTEKHIRKILNIQKRTRTCQENQAERMLKRMWPELQPGEVGDSMTIAIPPVDRGCRDARNSIGVITEKNKNDFYRVGAKQGLL